MQKTFSKLGEYMRKERANSYVAGRTSMYSTPDVMGKGMHIMMTKKVVKEDDMEWEGLADDDGEVDDDGDLDVE